MDRAAVEGLCRYLALLAAWNERVNLTGVRVPEDRVRVLVEEVLPAAALPASGSLIDVGSGNGSPGLVLGIVRPDVTLTLLEPRARRWAFLREAARAVGHPEVQVLRQRHSDYGGPAAETVTVRGLALPVEGFVPLVRVGGRLLVFGGSPRATPPLTLERSVGEDIYVFRHERST